MSSAPQNPSSLNFDKVHTFNKTAGIFTQETANPDVFKDTNLIGLRLSLIVEEIKELHEATNNHDFTEVIDALADILYVVYGMGSSLGIPLINEHCYRPTPMTNNMPDDCDIQIMYGYMESLNRAVMNQNFSEVAVTLMNMIDAVYVIAMKLGIDINRAFDIVHNSNMSKFPETETEAKNTVEWYRNNETRYDSPDYRYSEVSGRYVVFNRSTGKILKSIRYIPANFSTL